MGPQPLQTVDYFFLYTLISIWVLLLYNILLTLMGYKYSNRMLANPPNLEEMTVYPFVSLLIPAHNEEMVIEKTMRAILKLNYPLDQLEIIVINDNSNDKTQALLEGIKAKVPHRKIKIIQTDAITGGKGKSNALNIGFSHANGELIAIYDADNTPEANALLYLVKTITEDDHLGAVIGKFRVRNKMKNKLTRFINIETISFQWMSQAGRYELFGLCTIPGTNFIVRRHLIEKIGGWDPKAIAEDTEISIRIYELGYQIKFMPFAITWEQEPENLRVWLRQRTRWAKGNVYVLHKYLPRRYNPKLKRILIDLYYFFLVYFLFLTSVVVSDVIFILGLFTEIKVTLPGFFLLIWLLAFVLFILEVFISLTMEKGESTPSNLFHVMLMYFTYCQLWLIICFKGMFSYFKDLIFKQDAKWYKTERF